MRFFDAATHRPLSDPITGASGTAAAGWNPAATIIVTGSDDDTLQFFDSWIESQACSYLRTVMTDAEMDSLIGLDGAQSKCAHGGMVDRPPIPFLDLPLR